MQLYPQLLAIFLACFACGDEMSTVAYYVPSSQRCVHQPRTAPPPREAATVPVSPPAEKPSEPPKVDLNTASFEELQTLPRVGPAIAERIIEYRARRPFRRKRDIKRVRGIGSATYAKLRDKITVRRQKSKP